MNHFRYSVIIPVYNAEKTLSRCLDSLLPQLRGDTELLLIDDGSSDNSGAICRRYAEENACIKVFEKENGGVSSARNMGLQHAAGDYLLFVDSDDNAAADFFSAVDETLAVYDYDLILFSHCYTDGVKRTERIREPFEARTRDKLFSKLIETLFRKKSNGPVAKVFKRSIVAEHGIRFPEDIEIGEDRAFFVQYSFYMNSFCVRDRVLYTVRTENEVSLSRRRRDDLDRQTARLDAFLEEKLRCGDLPEAERAAYRETMNYDRLRMVYTKAKYLRRDGTPFFARLRKLRGICRELNREHLSYPAARYCLLTSLPVRWNLPLVIDAIAWKLTR